MARRGAGMQLVGAALVAVGAGLGVWGYRESQTLTHQVADALGSGVSQEVLVLYLAGVACIAAGIFCLVRR